MSTTERVTVTLPIELLEGIDRFDRNRGRFIMFRLPPRPTLRSQRTTDDAVVALPGCRFGGPRSE